MSFNSVNIFFIYSIQCSIKMC